MADMFGAPIGISKGMEDQNRNVLSGLAAAKTLGDIEQQPAELDLKQSHARLYRAEAETKEADAAAQRAIAAIARGNQSGEDATPEELAQNAVNLGARLTGAGFTKQGMALAKTGVDMTAKIATGEAAQASAMLRKIRAQTEQLTQRASFALGALNGGSQTAYETAKLAAVQAGYPEALDLPERFEDARPLLTQMVAQGTKAKDAEEMARKRLVDKARIGALGASAAKNSAARDVIQAKLPGIKILTNEIVKNGGKHSPEALAHQRELNETRAQARLLRDAVNFPPAPADPALRQEGKTYTAANGAKFRWQKGPDGKPAAYLIDMPKTLMPSGGKRSAITDTEVGADDDALELDDEVD